jgi:NTE family protein
MQQKLLATLLRDFFEIEDPAFLESVSGELELVDLPAGASLIAEGEQITDVFFIVQGRLRALARQDGRVFAAYDIGAGETIGELAFISNGPSPHGIIALRDSTLIRMSYAQFEQTLMERPKIALAVMRTIVNRARQNERTRRLPVPPRTICLIPITADADAPGFALSLQQYRVALGDAVRIILQRDPAGALGFLAPAAGADNATEFTIMVAEEQDSDWTRTCINLADEILLLADAGQKPALAPAELLLAGRAAEASVDRTLVLRHKAGTESPRNTADWLAPRAVKRHVHIRAGEARDLRRLTRLLAGRAIGVVLSGGGARGLAHIGVLNAIEDAGIEIDIIGGTSIGAVIAGWYAMEVRGEGLRAAARRAFVTGGNPVGDYNLLPLLSLSRGRRVRKLTEAEVIAAMGSLVAIEDCWTSYFCVAGNYSRAAEAVLDRGPLAKSMLASYAIPGVLPPIVLDGQLHVDGAAFNNMPVDVMEGFGAGVIIAVDLAVESSRGVDVEWLPGTAGLLLDSLKRIMGQRRRRRAPGITDILLRSIMLSSAGRQRDAGARADCRLTPKLPGIRFLDWGKLDAAVAAGYESAREQLAQAGAAEKWGNAPVKARPVAPEPEFFTATL